ncbi:DUF4806 domain-containing protein [Aphis craccivora]|uniref:DUF4806 domain-containing protein n=1 Tax=Aphis craccivora TaxID=307492 RepID=A0A6G0Y030_APHCR|nr:DUF4806 domain-containing protein [Aphis craccivora]
MSRRHLNRHTTSINKEKVGDNQSTIFASECLIPTKESVDSGNVLPSDEHPNTIEDLGLQSTNINFCNNFNDSNIPLTCDNDNIVNQLFTISGTQIEIGSILNKKLCQLIIKSEGLDVPKNARILLKPSKSKSHEINHIGNGSYIHIGVEFMIKPVLELYFDNLLHLDTL